MVQSFTHQQVSPQCLEITGVWGKRVDGPALHLNDTPESIAGFVTVANKVEQSGDRAQQPYSNMINKSISNYSG